jgi:hypothetical protein
MAKSNKNKNYKKNKKNSKRKTKRYKGGAEYYAAEGDPDRDSVDIGMESALGRIGVSNAPDDKQYGWLSVSIAGIIGIGGIGYLLLKKK